MSEADAGDGSGFAPEDDEEASAALTKIVADISRLPEGTEVRLELRDGEVRTGVKRSFGADGIQLDGHELTRFDQVLAFEAITAAEESPLTPEPPDEPV